MIAWTNPTIESNWCHPDIRLSAARLTVLTITFDAFNQMQQINTTWICTENILQLSFWRGSENFYH